MRISDGANPLDRTAVHPESYHAVAAMAADLKVAIDDLISNEHLRSRIEPQRYVTEKTGLPTLQDILSELAKPGRDPRETFEAVTFAEGVEKIEDVRPGCSFPA